LGNKAETLASHSNLESVAKMFVFFSMEGGRTLSKSIFAYAS